MSSSARESGGVPGATAETMIVLPPNDIGLVAQAVRDNDVAAIILEPTGAHMGADPVDPAFLSQLRELTESEGVVLIFDEVVTGFRTSKGGAQAYFGVTPDLTTMAKILAGGLPGGGVAGKAEIVNMIESSDNALHDAAQRVSHPGTFNANPLSSAAGAKGLELIETTPVNDTVDAMGARLRDGLNDVLSRMEIPGCASGHPSAVFLRLGLGLDHECERRPSSTSRCSARAPDDRFPYRDDTTLAAADARAEGLAKNGIQPSSPS